MAEIKSEKLYDLEERTAKFGEEVIDFSRQIPRDVTTAPLIGQLVRSGTSIGANYMEANGSSSEKDFANKIYYSLKESRETKFWLRMIARACPNLKEKCQLLWKESHELTLIFSKISHSAKKK